MLYPVKTQWRCTRTSSPHTSTLITPVPTCKASTPPEPAQAHPSPANTTTQCPCRSCPSAEICGWICWVMRSEEHTSELQSRFDLVCRLLLEKKKQKNRRR